MGVSMGKHVYLESDGKLLLVYGDGSGPAIPRWEELIMIRMQN